MICLFDLNVILHKSEILMIIVLVDNIVFLYIVFFCHVGSSH